MKINERVVRRILKKAESYTVFHAELQHLVGGDIEKWLADGESKLLENGVYMPLCIQPLQDRLVALSHLGIVRGKILVDPEVVFEVKYNIAEPISFQNDYTHTFSDVYHYENGQKFFEPKVKEGLRAFCVTWFKNLKAQGFMDISMQGGLA